MRQDLTDVGAREEGILLSVIRGFRMTQNSQGKRKDTRDTHTIKTYEKEVN